MLERLTWATDVRIARNGTERRSRWKTVPHYDYEWSVLALPGSKEASYLAGLTAPALFSIPLWPHAAKGGGCPTVIPCAAPAGAAGQSQLLSFDQAYNAAWQSLYIPPPAYPSPPTPLHITTGLTTGAFEYLDGSGTLQHNGAPFWLLVPSATGYLSVSRSANFVTKNLAQFKIQADMQPFFEQVTGLAPNSASVPVVSVVGQNSLMADTDVTSVLATAQTILVNDFSVPAVDQTDDSVSEIAFATTRGLEYRHTKRSVTIQKTCLSLAEIAALRRFLFAARGRLNAFTWQAPQDSAPSTWRLAADVVEISYTTNTIAQARLKLTEVSA